MFSFFSRGVEMAKNCFTTSINSWFVFNDIYYGPIDFLSSYMECILFKIINVKNIVNPINVTMC